MTADEIIQRRTGSAIRHKAGLASRLRGEKQTRHVRRSANAAMRLLDAVAVLFRVVDEFAQVLGGKIFLRDNDGGRMGGEADRLEVALGIILYVGRKHGSGNMGSHAPGCAAATRALPIVPPAPPTFSITMDWPRIFPICSVTMRATTSLGPPPGTGPHPVMGREGHAHGDGSGRVALRPRVPEDGTQRQRREREPPQRFRRSH